ncbi:hypothetical protein ACJ77P_09660 [Syntrophus buswellii]|uniref:hypothetical protein n=1 Tax=Syntrophus buswellii TaxID=43774 RepID=UPI0038D35DDF
MDLVSWIAAVDRGQKDATSREATNIEGAEPILFFPGIPARALILQIERERSKKDLSL